MGPRKKYAKAATNRRTSIYQVARTSGKIDTLIGLQLRKLRKAKKITLEEVADELRMTYQQVQKYETGRNRISASTLLCIATHLNYPIEDFFQLAIEYLKEPMG